ncbi:hypothetical protein [Bosea sp. PAMC 26642]|uniref:hypothetical protein n=1 Tax=Bosea sp. (strain PAMC 26642) TaxID=1792307 RepID=UPI0007701FB6|nr:hypothetical protein [Bosea sp. PAMC 26642]AMJ59929.1 hypothetical protein AXW83_06140 [Bosea sp. PAMC 26642]
MTTASSHSSPISLHHLAFDDTIRPVIGELAAMSLSNPTDRDYAAFIRNGPSLVAIAARCTQRTAELERFIELAQVSAPYFVRNHVATPHALAILNEEATLALALLPARAPADRHAQREHGFALIRAVQELDDPALEPLARAAFGIETLSATTAGAVATNALAHAVARYREGASDQSPATSHSVEDAAALRAFVVQVPDFEALYRDVDVHARAAARLAAMLVERDLARQQHDDIAMALEGAELQARIALLRIAVASAHTEIERWSRLAGEVIPHPTPKFAATLTLAAKMGESLRDMLAAHPLD